MLQLSLATSTTLALSLVTPHTFHPGRCCCCCLQLVTVPVCEHPWYGVAHCRQELHASSVVVARFVLSFSILHFSFDDKFRGRFRITPTRVHFIS